ncbi:MAG TPA: FAD-dependent oxidoreductase [Chitinophagaceae bacterium]|nr:FAD-dependent oxidoreductase [Chitinophagaceae bacterium]
MDVTIIGGGVIGLCCSYYLRKEGFEVTVIERGDLSDGCSFGNMGYVSPSHFIPLASPGIVSQGLRWMLSSRSPFYIRPRFNRELIDWGLRFWKNANSRTVARNVPHLYQLLRLSRELMNELKDALPGSFTMIEKGCWMLYRDPKTGEHEKKLADQAEKLGLRTLICDAQTVQEYEPDVRVHVAGGVLYLDDCHVDSAQFMRTIYSWLRDNGVRFWLNTGVHSFSTENGGIRAIQTDKGEIPVQLLVLANGSWMGKTAKLAGIRLPLQPGKGYSVVYDGLERNTKYPSILVERRTATTPIGKWLRIGGTMELSGHDNRILPRRVRAIYDAVKEYYPDLDIQPPDPAKAWFGYRPVTPDGMPCIGKTGRYSNLYFAGGHAMLGLSAAAATGKLLGELIGEKETSIPVSAFDPERFMR